MDGGMSYWHCTCSCGERRIIAATSITAGTSKSCGCLAAELSSIRRRTHKMTGAPEYRTWNAMKQRCTNKKNQAYKDYGGRGITICEEWANSFQAFFDYIGKRPSIQHEIDRIDNSRGYEPGNVRWSTAKENSLNRRNNVLLTHNGETLTVSQWAEKLGVKYSLIWSRIKTGWTPSDALTIPSGSKPRMKRGPYKKNR